MNLAILGRSFCRQPVQPLSGSGPSSSRQSTEILCSFDRAIRMPCARVKIAPCTFAPSNRQALIEERLRSAAHKSASINFTLPKSEPRRSQASKIASEKSTSMKSFQHKFDRDKSVLQNRTPFSSDRPNRSWARSGSRNPYPALAREKSSRPWLDTVIPGHTIGNGRGLAVFAEPAEVAARFQIGQAGPVHAGSEWVTGRIEMLTVPKRSPASRSKVASRECQRRRFAGA